MTTTPVEISPRRIAQAIEGGAYNLPTLTAALGVADEDDRIELQRLLRDMIGCGYVGEDPHGPGRMTQLHVTYPATEIPECDHAVSASESTWSDIRSSPDGAESWISSGPCAHCGVPLHRAENSGQRTSTTWTPWRPIDEDVDGQRPEAHRDAPLGAPPPGSQPDPDPSSEAAERRPGSWAEEQHDAWNWLLWFQQVLNERLAPMQTLPQMIRGMNQWDEAIASNSRGPADPARVHASQVFEYATAMLSRAAKDAIGAALKHAAEWGVDDPRPTLPAEAKTHWETAQYVIERVLKTWSTLWSDLAKQPRRNRETADLLAAWHNLADQAASTLTAASLAFWAQRR